MKPDVLCLYCGNEFEYNTIRRSCPKCNERTMLRKINPINKLDQYASDPRPWPQKAAPAVKTEYGDMYAWD